MQREKATPKAHGMLGNEHVAVQQIDKCDHTTIDIGLDAIRISMRVTDFPATVNILTVTVSQQ